MEPAASAAAARGPLRPRAGSSRAHRPFALVLSGGGARGLAHVGVLRALEHLGLRPSGIVGVSMGAIVGAVYALNEDWYDALVGVDVERLPGVANGSSSGPMGRLRSAVASGRAIGQMVLSWGTWAASEPTIRALLAEVTLGKAIDEGRIPFAAVATDLRTERRFVIERGSAADAIYASAALAGILPPHRQGDALLVDGVYADGAPVDVARGMGVEAVVAVDVNQRRRAIIQGGMGVAVSNWRLANTVASYGQLGVVSGTGIDTVMVRRLQDGDPGQATRAAPSSTSPSPRWPRRSCAATSSPTAAPTGRPTRACRWPPTSTARRSSGR
jgi:NTE family protein